MNRFRELKVWQKAVALATKVYKVTEHIPTTEKFGLISQMQRAAVSIASNIAEGAGRNSSKEFVNFLSMAYGSAYELETQVEISKNLNYIKEEEYQDLIDSLVEIQKMIYSLKSSLLTQDSLLKTQN